MPDLQFITNILIKLNIKIPEVPLKEEIVRFLTESNSERVVEIPLVLRAIPEKKSRILDVGCRYSILPIQLASLGYEVHGIDINTYNKRHPNFIFCRGDILKPNYKASSFDVVISLSTLEHIGLGRYGDQINERGDIQTVEQIYKLLKPQGIFILSVPFGKATDTKWYRVYDCKRIKDLVRKFDVLEERVFISKNNYWIPSDFEESEKVDSSVRTDSMLFLKLIKK